MKTTKAELLDALVADARTVLNLCYGLRELELGAKVENLTIENARSGIRGATEALRVKLAYMEVNGILLE